MNDIEVKYYTGIHRKGVTPAILPKEDTFYFVYKIKCGRFRSCKGSIHLEVF